MGLLGFSQRVLAGGVLNITAPSYLLKIVATDLQKGGAAPLLTSNREIKLPGGVPLRAVFLLISRSGLLPSARSRRRRCQPVCDLLKRSLIGRI
jgi:hypothetical protein